MYVERHSVTVTTDGSGDATAYTATEVTGCVVAVIYTKTDYADTVDFTITSETTVQNIWVESNVTASTQRAPRQATHATTGAASLYAAAGTAVNDYIYVARERLKIVLAQGGATKIGVFTFLIA